jgi:small conductance mechanosensitive channel
VSGTSRASIRDYTIVVVYFASMALLAYVFYEDILTYLEDLQGTALILKGAVLAGTLIATYLTAKFADRILKRVVVIGEYPEVVENLMVRAGVAGVWIVGLFIILGQLGVDTTDLIAGLGIVGLGISFAAKDVLGNFFAGGLLTIDRPFDVGDWIQVGEKAELYGTVQEIDMFRTYITTRDYVAYSIPNSEVMNSTLVNYTRPDERYRVQFFLGISYESDLDLARDILLETIRQYRYLSKDRPIWIYVDELGDFAMKLRVRFFIPHVRLRRRATDFVLPLVSRRYEENGIVMPYPTQEVILERRESAVEEAESL